LVQAVQTLDGNGGAESYERLIAAYGEAGRAYHNLQHLESVLAWAERLRRDQTPEAWARIVLALAYHDAVYDPRATDNEVQSAETMRASLSPLGVGEGDLAEIARLILATRDHRAGDPDAALVVDADLAILQSSPDEYDRYAAAIREEYAFVPVGAYHTGRTRVLEGLMARRLFTSPRLDESRARENMAREIRSLA
jgi:predicted metal-dependent HD superfamily phosphohydrolase